jgi:radical SAM protein with 4Fe4S-binding SPASM domain
MLIANATAAAQLSASGVVIAKEWLDGKNEAEIAADLQAHFRGTTAPQIQADLKQVQDLIRKLAAPGDEYPIFNLEDAAVSPFETELIAPLEADIPLADPELVVPVLDRVWQVGIPHVTILVPENPDTAHLVRAVERAEDLGMICGISGRASDLGQDSLLEDVAKAGVDHVTVFFASAEPDIHDSLFGAGDHRSAQQIFERTQKLEVADVGHVPLVASTAERLDETLALLQQLKVSNVIFFAIATEADENSEGAIPAKAMRQVAAQVEEDAHQGQLRYLWEVPVKRNPELSLSAQVRQGPRCSGDIAVRIEPDGSVIPPRGPRLIAGNILQDSWDSIWNHPVFQRYRERVEAPTRCEICPGLTICAADCPVKPEGWS